MLVEKYLVQFRMSQRTASGHDPCRCTSRACAPTNTVSHRKTTWKTSKAGKRTRMMVGGLVGWVGVGGLVGRVGGPGRWVGEVTFQSVDRHTHECHWFLSHQRHLDIRATIKKEQKQNTSGKNEGHLSWLHRSPNEWMCTVPFEDGVQPLSHRRRPQDFDPRGRSTEEHDREIVHER